MHLIQSVRLVHALMELEVDVCVEEAEVPIFEHLRRSFTLRYEPATPGDPVLAGVEVSHDLPETRVGHLSRPLIFPTGIVDRCREAWDEDRPQRFLFQGLLTQERARVLKQWLVTQLFGEQEHERAPMLADLEPVAADALGLRVERSARGRDFPVKAWDERYITALGRSRFVLCPSGDYVWTYRFFEAVFSGAIPVVQRSCAAYEGFRYRAMDEPASDMEWHRDIAEHNAALAAERLTVPKPELSQAVLAALASQIENREVG